MQSAAVRMTGAAEQRLITSESAAGPTARASDNTTSAAASAAASAIPAAAVRNTILSLVLILLSGLAVVQTVAVTDPPWTWETVRRATPRVLLGAAAQGVAGVAL